MIPLLKLLRWEFWPYQLFYIPVYLTVLAIGARLGRLTFFTAANPLLRLGGFVDYSKWQAQRHLPREHTPVTILVERDTPFAEVTARMSAAGIGWPCFAKPDRGERGFGVRRIADEVELAAYLEAAGDDTLIQQFVHGCEFGVLYARIPGQPHGRITSIVVKQNLYLEGDGRRTMRRLIEADIRLRLQRRYLYRTFFRSLDTVPARGRRILLRETGNHNQGATFLDGAHLNTPALLAHIERLAQSLPGFYIGRFDLRAASEDALLGGAFRVLEVNGSNSEPCHIYRPHNSLVRGYRDLIRHWALVARVSRAAMREGARPATVAELFAAIGSHSRRKREAGRATGYTPSSARQERAAARGELA